jgi:hypothetical protein
MNRGWRFCRFNGWSIVLSRAGLWSVQHHSFTRCLGSIGLHLDYSMRGFCNSPSCSPTIPSVTSDQVPHFEASFASTD